MNIVIVGAGQTGRHVSALLSSEQHNVILVDLDPIRLEQASWIADIAVREGSGTDWQLLDDLRDYMPDLFIALTSDDQTNLVACSLAKNLGYPRTIARVRDSRYLNRTRLDFARMFDVDTFIGPELLVAHEINKFLISPGSLRVENFAHGAVQMRTVIVPPAWEKSDRPLRKLDLPDHLIVALIRRGGAAGSSEKKKVIFPHGEDHILPFDELTVIGENEAVSKIHQYFGFSERKAESVVIVGGSRTAINLADLLKHRGVSVRIIEKDYNQCCRLTELLPEVTVIHHDGTDLDFLKSQRVDQAGAFIVSTRRDELNMMIGLLGKEAGCESIIVQLANEAYFPIAERTGITHAASPWTLAAHRILGIAFSESITSMVSLYQDQAEILEIQVSMNSPLVGIPLSDLGPHLPKDFLIAVIQNRGRIMVAHGKRIISPNDTVIVVTSPKHFQDLKGIF